MSFPKYREPSLPSLESVMSFLVAKSKTCLMSVMLTVLCLPLRVPQGALRGWATAPQRGPRGLGEFLHGRECGSGPQGECSVWLQECVCKLSVFLLETVCPCNPNCF